MSDIIAINRRLDEIELLLERLRKSDNGVATSTFSPTYFGSSSVGITTYTLQSGNWARAGPIAVVTGQVTWTAVTGTGSARIGMPGNLAPASDSVGVIYANAVTFANSAPMSIIQSSGGGQLRLFSPLTNAAPTEVAIEAAGDIRFMIVYLI